MKEDSINVCRKWVELADYQFKVLILASVLEENNLAYYGTYTSMCEWLGIGDNTTNINKLKEAVEELQKNNIIEIENKSKRKFAIFITKKGKKDERIVEIKKQWVEILKTHKKADSKSKTNRSWDTMLKALIVILDKMEEVNNGLFYLEKQGVLMTMNELAFEIGKSSATAGKILKELKECNFEDGFIIDKKVIYTTYEKANGTKAIKGMGTYITKDYDKNIIGYNWETETDQEQRGKKQKQ